MSKKEIFKRYILFILCLFFMGIGVALTKHGELGVSPISSVANVISIKFSFLSFGTWLTISNCVLLLGQVILLRKNFMPFQLLQIPLSFLFGYFTDFGLYLASFILQLLLYSIFCHLQYSHSIKTLFILCHQHKFNFIKLIFFYFYWLYWLFLIKVL